MNSSYTAVIQRDGHWWIGWIEEIPGVNSQGETKEELVENLRSALEEALEMNRSDALNAASDGFEEVRLQGSRDTMKKSPDNHLDDELRDEYDFSELEGGVRGKYAEQYKKGTNLVLLDPDVAKAFPTDQAVNDALRMLMEIAVRQSADSTS